MKVSIREFLSSGTAEEPLISGICKATTTTHGGKKSGDILYVLAGLSTNTIVPGVHPSCIFFLTKGL